MEQFTVIPLNEFIKDYVAWVVELCDGNKSQAADLLKIDRKRIYAKLSEARGKAHNAINYAIIRGWLPKPSTLTCVDCGEPAASYDHRDYHKPMEVEPVCRACNNRRGPAHNEWIVLKR